MTFYSCYECNYFSSNKTNFNKHIRTPKHLNALKDDGGKNDKSCFFNSNYSKLLNFTHFECSYCKKEFKRKYNYERHLTTCKNKNTELNDIKQQMDILKKQKDELAKQLEDVINKIGTTNYNNTINQTNNNNIQINIFGSEDLSHITNEMKTGLVKIPFGMIQKLVKMVHKDNPMNDNFRINNIRDNKIIVFTENGWQYMSKQLEYELQKRK